MVEITMFMTPINFLSIISYLNLGEIQVLIGTEIIMYIKLSSDYITKHQPNYSDFKRLTSCVRKH